MKKIINGSLFDTNTAKKLGEYFSGEYVNDLHFYSETLYRTKSGKYFLYGDGNAGSKYNESMGNNSWSGSSEIISMDRESAVKWVEENLTADEYMELFGIPEESDNEDDELLTVSIPASMKAKLREIVENRNISFTRLVNKIISENMDKYINVDPSRFVNNIKFFIDEQEEEEQNKKEGKENEGKEDNQ